MTVLTNMPIRVYRRFVVNENGCWLWQGAKRGGNRDMGRASYGEVKVNGIVRYIHHLAYETIHRHLPYGRDVDHLCVVRLCGNPWHLQAVTHREHARRTRARTAVA